jgi:membrane fusion protein (multidrug efflux system)
MEAALRALETNPTVVRERREPAPTPTLTPAPALAPARRWLTQFRAPIALSLALLLAGGGTAWILAPASSESTDDAYVAVDATTIAPKVRGLVAEVLVHDNQSVEGGDPLVRIDAEEFDARVASARADLADAEAGVAAARAALVSLDAEQRLAGANMTAAETAIKSSSVQSERASADARRYDALVASGAVALRDADAFRAAAITAAQDEAHANALFEVAGDASQVTAARRPGLQAALLKATATVERARSALDLALQDQRHTLILAPIAGVVGNRQVQQGDYVQPGTRLLTLVPIQSLYVTANFKETQTGRMRPGQRVKVRVDALSDQPLTGVIESLAPGSSSQFALLPFEPGTGNFTKIVQRVPVRIRFDAGQPALAALRPGLSVTAKVTLGR